MLRETSAGDGPAFDGTPRKAEGGSLPKVMGPAAATVGYQLVGADTWVHEHGHVMAIKALERPQPIQVSTPGMDMLGGFLRHPSWRGAIDLLGAYLQGKGAGGVTSRYGAPPTPLGQALGQEHSLAAISAAGSVTQDMPGLAMFAGGYALRKRDPSLGAGMMLAGAAQHTTTVAYAWDAVSMSPQQLHAALLQGHDWASVSLFLGVPPIVPALGLTALLPVEAAGLIIGGKIMGRAADNRRALAELLKNGRLSDAELKELFDGYPKKTELARAEADFRSHRSLAAASKEFSKFESYLVRKKSALITEERKQLPKTAPQSFWQSAKAVLSALKGAFLTDPAGSGLRSASLAGGLAVAAAELAKGVGAAAAGGALDFLLPGLGLTLLAARTLFAARTARNPYLDRTEKILGEAQAAGGALVAAGMIVPALAPVLLPIGVAGMVGSAIGRWLYGRLL